MKQNNKISLIHKSLTGQLTDQEQAELDILQDAQENKELAAELKELWDLTADYKPTKFSPNTAAAFHKFKEEIASETKVETKVIKMNPMYWVSRIAAAFIFVVAAVFLFNNSKGADFNTQLATTDTIESTRLSDGTIVYLDNNSSLELASAFGTDNRTVKINGSAYFDVARDESKPFIVHMGDNTLEVLGTAFNIDNKNNDRVVVEVESGVVKVKTATKVSILEANDAATLEYKKDVITNTKVASTKVFDWYKASLSVENETIVEVVERAEIFYGVKIALSSNVNRACLLTSPLLEETSIDQLFEVLKVTYQMEVEKVANLEYEIKHLDCK